MSEWREVRLGDICTELSDGLHKAPLFVEGGDYIFVNAKNLCDGVIVDNDPTKKTTHEEYLKYSKPLNENTILFSIDGTIGNIARYKGEKCVLGKGACYINPNPVLVDSSYIYFQLQSPHFNSYLNCMSTGSTIKHISLKTMRNYEFTLPPLSEQRSIASILSALDDKIAVNRRICENLEAQAQALFKHWFIDFAPFKNGKFVESELGMIPEGWRVMSIDDIYSIKYGKNLPTSKIKEKGDYPVYGANGIMGYYNTYNYDNYVTLITSRGSGSGDVSRTFQEKAFITNNSFAVNPKDNYSYLGCGYTYYCIKNINFKPFCSGSAQPQLTNTSISAISILLPDKNVVIKYNSLASYIQKEINQAYIESNRLATLRDTLLPKLMSGQIKV